MEQQNTEKLSDKAFARLILTSVFGVLLCLVLLCSTTYAWFTADVPSNNNEIKSATHCDLSVSVYKDGVALENIASGVSLKAGNYTVTLTLPKDSASGYYALGKQRVTTHHE